MARPPEMMIFAEVSSGRSDFDSSSPTKADTPGSAAAEAAQAFGAMKAVPLAVAKPTVTGAS